MSTNIHRLTGAILFTAQHRETSHCYRRFGYLGALPASYGAEADWHFETIMSGSNLREMGVIQEQRTTRDKKAKWKRSKNTSIFFFF